MTTSHVQARDWLPCELLFSRMRSCKKWPRRHSCSQHWQSPTETSLSKCSLPAHWLSADTLSSRITWIACSRDEVPKSTTPPSEQNSIYRGWRDKCRDTVK